MDTVIPLYAHLKKELLQAIASGEYAPGDQLPSQRELIQRYGASLMTVRRAINELSHAGVIYSVPGKGLYVSEHKRVAEAGPLISFTEDMARRGMCASSRLLCAELAPASTMLGRALEVEVGERLVHLRRLRLADGFPMAIQISYLPHRFCPGLLEHDLERGSLYEILRNVYQLRLVTSQVSVEALLAEQEQAALLGVPLPAALLATEQITRLEGGAPVEFTRSLYRGDQYRLIL